MMWSAAGATILKCCRASRSAVPCDGKESRFFVARLFVGLYLHDFFGLVQIPALIVSITSDVLYPPDEQLELANNIPNAQHHTIQSWEGHDGFLLEDKKVGTLLRGFLAQIAPRSSL
mmetsp:Transcript_60707/g.162865  ORF Transcript_60707/g.162865 Transcript_60707/m.162865 type:complete len:117 (-) Transcript_60707:140-490(-)